MRAKLTPEMIKSHWRATRGSAIALSLWVAVIALAAPIALYFVVSLLKGFPFALILALGVVAPILLAFIAAVGVRRRDQIDEFYNAAQE